jgi:hypothetical protein
MSDRAAFAVKPSMGEPRPLPYCPYPSAADIVQHGVQILPAILPLVGFERAAAPSEPSVRHGARHTPAQVMRLAEVVGMSFA